VSLPRSPTGEYLDSILKVVKRLLLSALLGLALTFLLFVGMHYASETWVANTFVDQFLTRLYFWPIHVLPWPLRGLDCPNADTIGDKMECVLITDVVNVLAYSMLSYGLLWVLNRRQTA